VFVVFPEISYAASSVLKPIISTTGSCVCTGSAPDWGCVLQTIQTFMGDFVAFATVIMTIFIAWAGFTYIQSPTNAEKRSQANARILNAIIGLVIVLCAWLLVDTVMKTLYADNGGWGPWNKILISTTAGAYCIKPHTPAAGSISTIFSQITNTTANGTGGNVQNATLTNTGVGACSASSVRQAATAGGYNISNAEANTLACIAKPESTCGANTTGATTPTGKATSASGPWQNVFGYSDKCHSLTIPACGNLNCYAAYSGGKPRSDPASQATAQQCQAAMANLTCSAAAAACLVQENGNYSAWTSDSRSSVQQACIQKYASGS
jgi:hypothetical protein